MAIPDRCFRREPGQPGHLGPRRRERVAARQRRDQLKLFRDYATNAPLYPALHEYLRTSGVPVLAVWGEGDPIFGPDGARAFAKDAVDPEIHLLDGGHFLLETHVDEVAGLIDGFLHRRVR